MKVPENKLTAKSPIEPLPLPEKVIIPLHQNIGAPCNAVVKRGEKVLTGQKIGDSEKFVNAPVHATISGEITATTTVINPPTGKPVTALVITSDGADRWVELDKSLVSSQQSAVKPVGNQQSAVGSQRGRGRGLSTIDYRLSTEEDYGLSALDSRLVLDRIRAAGLVGLGGAIFPTHVKLSPPRDKKIDTVILNGCECEPYITSDHRVMLEYGEQVLSGLNIIKKVLSPDNIYIAIEDNKADAIDHLGKLIVAMGFDFKIIPLKSKYPMGAEKILTKLVLGREVPIGGLPLDVGVVVHNVSTTKAIHDAVFEGRPFVERVVTVTGAVKNPKNLLVRLGTPLRSLIDYCGGIQSGVRGQGSVCRDRGAGADLRSPIPDSSTEVILGGPFMGISQPDLDFPVTKGTNCVLVKEGRRVKEQDCISCGRCLEVCPMHLVPTMLVRNARASRYDDCKKTYYIDNCFECGACAYTCPASIPIVQYIKVAKSELIKRVISE
ncbi:MAG: Electron transport complex subunit RnfC [Chloroflexi bacterium]|nr:Electron transport complex subunit RnfC [Chloroflexota bacterium]